MKTLDFLFYFLVRWLQKIDRRTTKTVSYPERVSYILAMCFLCWLMTIDAILEYLLFNGTFVTKVPLPLFIILAMIVIYLLKYIYIKKERYNHILGKSDPKFNMSYKLGITISLLFFFFTFAVFMLLVIILHSLK